MVRIPVIFLLLFFSTLVFNPAMSGAQTSGGLNAEGIHTEPWFNNTTGDLSRDLQAANEKNQKLAIFWEQQGCVYCQKMHEINLKIEGTVHFIRKYFYVVQLNMRGKRQIKDFDGEVMDEANLSRAHRVSGTPTVEFRDAQANEVFRLPGYAEPLIFHGIFDYVASSGYKDSSLVPWLKANYLGKKISSN